MLGMEFSGHDPTGRRVMGLLPAKGLATSVDADKRFLWDVPSSWSVSSTVCSNSMSLKSDLESAQFLCFKIDLAQKYFTFIKVILVREDTN